MKLETAVAMLCLALLPVGCGKKTADDQSTPPAPAAPATPAAESAVAPAAEPAMTAFQQGDTPAALTSFVETDWSRRPLFASSSVLSLTEEQFTALPAAERQARSKDMLAQLDVLRRLAAVVVEAARGAGSSGDPAQARKYLNALKACGTALDSTNSLRLTQLVGQGLKKKAEAELGKLAP